MTTSSQDKESRAPDLSARCGRIAIAGWFESDRGWSFQLSRSYSTDEEGTKYDQVRLFPTDLPVVAALLAKITNHVIRLDDNTSEFK